MIAELNRLIESCRLPLAPFSSEGLSSNPTADGAVFLLTDDKNSCVRFYTNAVALTPALRDNAPLLLSILMLSGPAGPAPEIRIGTDARGNFLWLSSFISYSECREDIFTEKFRRFESQSALVRSEIIRRINEVAMETSRRSVPLAASPMPSTKSMEALGETVSSDELSRLFASPQVYWG